MLWIKSSKVLKTKSKSIIVSTIYLKEFVFFVLSLLPFVAIILSGRGSQTMGLLMVVLVVFGITGVVTSFIHNAIEGTVIQMTFMAVCGVVAVVGYFGLSAADK